ncbi:hypothetical protein KXR53_31645 [Inquilinus limosus]|uniref:hypothetical protein n=1 Tax=Inquilinus limosus TaxID=171674 RepID=UPI003F18549F
MGHIQQLAFALGPIEIRPAAPARPRPSPQPAKSTTTAIQPLLLPEAPAPSPAAPAAEAVPAAVTPAPPPPAAEPEFRPPSALDAPPVAEDAAPVEAALYVVTGFARGRERRRSGWRRLPEQGFASRRLAEAHAARLLACGRADGVILARQTVGAEMEAMDEPVILERRGELPAELLEG